MTPRRLRSNSGSGEIFDSNGDMQDRYGYKIPETLLPQYTDWLEATKDENKRRSESEANAPIRRRSPVNWTRGTTAKGSWRLRTTWLRTRRPA